MFQLKAPAAAAVVVIGLLLVLSIFPMFGEDENGERIVLSKWPEKGGAGLIPVKFSTICLKFVVSVVRTVVGARREA